MEGSGQRERYVRSEPWLMEDRNKCVYICIYLCVRLMGWSSDEREWRPIQSLISLLSSYASNYGSLLLNVLFIPKRSSSTRAELGITKKPVLYIHDKIG